MCVCALCDAVLDEALAAWPRLQCAQTLVAVLDVVNVPTLFSSGDEESGGSMPNLLFDLFAPRRPSMAALCAHSTPRRAKSPAACRCLCRRP